MQRPLRATYRVQLHAGFGFDAAAAIADYLAALGISHLYSSPYLQAAPGSTHGYDVDRSTSRVNEELGGGRGPHAALLRALARARTRADPRRRAQPHGDRRPRQRWWWDVLENGPASRYASYFDVDWDPPESAAAQHGAAAGARPTTTAACSRPASCACEREGGGFAIRYHDARVPARPALARRGCSARPRPRAAAPTSSPSSPTRSRACRSPTATDRASVRRRHRDKEVLRGQLARLLPRGARGAAAAIDAELIGEINATPTRSTRCSSARTTGSRSGARPARDLGYRRFFDINTLVGLRVEDERVFADTHAARPALARGRHARRPAHRPPRRPARSRATTSGGCARRAPAAWIVAEKILAPGERLRETGRSTAPPATTS